MWCDTYFDTEKLVPATAVVVTDHFHFLIDSLWISAAKIVETAKKTGATVSGPIPLPTEKEVVTILRAVHKYKDSREQFEQRTHKRLIDVVAPTQKTIDALQKIDLSAGVFIDVKMK